MNKRQRKKLCCPKCGNRYMSWVVIDRNRFKLDCELSCKVCAKSRRKLMREVMQELGEVNPVLGAFMKIGGSAFPYAGLL